MQFAHAAFLLWTAAWLNQSARLLVSAVELADPSVIIAIRRSTPPTVISKTDAILLVASVLLAEAPRNELVFAKVFRFENV